MEWLMMALSLGAMNAGRENDEESAGLPPQRVRSILLAPGQHCPEAAAGEVVVCAAIEEPYRIPKALRRSELAKTAQSWVNRAAVMDDAGRVAAGLPDTCSVVGTGGQTGCAQADMRAWAAERRQIAAGSHQP